ncbi:Aste57867_24497 [Aphanomyces stellatus]|uniref:Aste57867_24497 protein n=1 Tax=Aphanomyces stellatus TaxID=120398 RepID=A0A485LRM7_9STRA|nr:hypothetical protein As57867_024420 [Aphanomyces stellatus]VFU01136.1 Aste57867_24497 [Aphanomyces stellatus]
MSDDDVGWIALVDPTSGGTYYMNTATRETTWELPPGASIEVGAFEVHELHEPLDDLPGSAAAVVEVPPSTKEHSETLFAAIDDEIAGEATTERLHPTESEANVLLERKASANAMSSSLLDEDVSEGEDILLLHSQMMEHKGAGEDDQPPPREEDMPVIEELHEPTLYANIEPSQSTECPKSRPPSAEASPPIDRPASTAPEHGAPLSPSADAPLPMPKTKPKSAPSTKKKASFHPDVPTTDEPPRPNTAPSSPEKGQPHHKLSSLTSPALTFPEPPAASQASPMTIHTSLAPTPANAAADETLIPSGNYEPTTHVHGLKKRAPTVPLPPHVLDHEVPPRPKTAPDETSQQPQSKATPHFKPTESPHTSPPLATTTIKHGQLKRAPTVPLHTVVAPNVDAAPRPKTAPKAITSNMRPSSLTPAPRPILFLDDGAPRPGALEDGTAKEPDKPTVSADPSSTNQNEQSRSTMVAGDDTAATVDWIEAYDDRRGLTYYYDPASGAVSWERPPLSHSAEGMTARTSAAMAAALAAVPGGTTTTAMQSVAPPATNVAKGATTPLNACTQARLDSRMLRRQACQDEKDAATAAWKQQATSFRRLFNEASNAYHGQVELVQQKEAARAAVAGRERTDRDAKRRHMYATLNAARGITTWDAVHLAGFDTKRLLADLIDGDGYAAERIAECRRTRARRAAANPNSAFLQAKVDAVDEAAIRAQVATLQPAAIQQALISSRSDDGDSLLHAAVWQGSLVKAKHLISLGADVNLVDNSVTQWTPLHEAARAGNVNMTKLLLTAGAAIGAADAAGDTALHWACRGGHTTVVKVLLHADPSFTTLNARNLKKKTPPELVRKPTLRQFLVGASPSPPHHDLTRQVDILDMETAVKSVRTGRSSVSDAKTRGGGGPRHGSNASVFR